MRAECTNSVQQALGHSFTLIPPAARTNDEAHRHFTHAQVERLVGDEGRLVDLCFIDGDHSFEGVSRDYNSLRERCRLLLFHDIVAEEVPGVPRFWGMLKADPANAGLWHDFLQQPVGTALRANDTKGLLGIGLLEQRHLQPKQQQQAPPSRTLEQKQLARGGDDVHASDAARSDSLPGRAMMLNMTSRALRTYLSSTYRDEAAFDAMTHAQLRQLASQLAWAYLPSVRSLMPALRCRERFEDIWRGARLSQQARRSRKTLCGAEAEPLSTALHFEPPTLTSLSFSQYGYFVPFNVPYACAEAPPRFAPDGTWTEVLRLGGDTPSSRPRKGDGCWFVQARGSGVFAATGRSLRATSRAILPPLLGLNSSSISHRAYARYGAYAVEATIPVCAHARALGYDTVQLWDEHCGGKQPCWVELLSCQDACMDADKEPDKSKQDTAPGLPLRTGRNASQPCACRMDEGYRLLNCHGTQPSVLAHRRADRDGDLALAVEPRCATLAT